VVGLSYEKWTTTANVYNREANISLSQFYAFIYARLSLLHGPCLGREVGVASSI
jgi:hypothetical protein